MPPEELHPNFTIVPCVQVVFDDFTILQIALPKNSMISSAWSRLGFEKASIPWTTYSKVNNLYI